MIQIFDKNMFIKHSKIYNTIIILAIVGLMVPALSFAEPLTAPETVDEVKTMGDKALEYGKNSLPGVLKDIWKNEAMPIWQKMYNWFMSNIYPVLKGQYDKWIKPEIEKRKPTVNDEFQKEKDEMKESVKDELPSVWQKIKNFFK